MAVQVLVYKQANKHLKHDNIVMRASAVISIELLLISNVGYDSIVGKKRNRNLSDKTRNLPKLKLGSDFDTVQFPAPWFWFYYMV